MIKICLLNYSAPKRHMTILTDLNESHDAVNCQTGSAFQAELAHQLPQQRQPRCNWSPRRQLFLHQRLQSHMTEDANNSMV